MSYIASLDQGTSSTRCMIFDSSGSVVAMAQKEHQQFTPKPGWVEHDAGEIWLRTKEVIGAAIALGGISASEISAIGVTNQRETIVAWDSHTGVALHNAIVWQDTRTADFLNGLSDEVKADLIGRTGLAIAPYFSASKIHWLLNNVESVKNARAEGKLKVGTIDSWLVWNLTGGVHITDVTNASRTMLMNLETLDWDRDLLAIFGIPIEILPVIKSSSEIYGNTKSDGPFGSEIPIAGILGDQHAAMVGQSCFDKGSSKTTYGTGNFALLNTGSEIIRSKHGLLTTVCFKFGDQPAKYALEGSVAVTGAAIQWLGDKLQIITSADEIDALASSVKDTADVYFVPAFSGLFAPYWRSDARGVIVGLTSAATKAHLARATLEAICYQTMEIMEAMAADSEVALTQMRVDGGVTASELCMQLQADVMGIEIVRPLITETTALGAAYAAGLAIGYWESIDEVKAIWRESKRWKPSKTAEERAQGAARWKEAVARTLNWVQ
ncbi:GlpK Glycerol kinase [Candidatus Nanopelagicaceae bacterium]